MSIPIFNCFKSKQQKPRNKIIVFANQKGGAGKTTNCVLLGNTLIEHKHPFVLIDGDPQRSIVKKHEQDHERFPDLEPLYQIYAGDLDNEQRTVELVNAMREEDYDFVVDTPGNLSLEGMLPLLFAADAIITPIQLEKTCINSTNSFIETLLMCAKETGTENIPPIYFIPNQYNKGWGRKDELQERQKDLDYYNGIGRVTPKVPNAAEIQRYNTLFMTDRQKEILAPCHNFLLERIYNEQITKK